MSDEPHPEHPIAEPPQIWGPPGPWPTPPIYYPPVYPMPPIYNPPGIWGPPGPWPSPPIYLPPQAPPGAHPMPPIYYPPSIWPSPGRPTHPIVLPDPPTQPPVTLPDPATGYWVVSPGQPCMWVTADDPDAAAANYGRSMQLTVGENLIVFTAQEAYVVTTSADVQVEPVE